MSTESIVGIDSGFKRKQLVNLIGYIIIISKRVKLCIFTKLSVIMNKRLNQIPFFQSEKLFDCFRHSPFLCLCPLIIAGPRVCAGLVCQCFNWHTSTLDSKDLIFRVHQFSGILKNGKT